MTLRDILNPWGALREARNTLEGLVLFLGAVRLMVERAEHERDALRAELDRLAPKRDAKTGRFVG